MQVGRKGFATICFITQIENAKMARNGKTKCKDVARRSQGGRKEGARHMLSSILGPCRESTISKYYKPIEAERAKATDDLKIED